MAMVHRYYFQFLREDEYCEKEKEKHQHQAIAAIESTIGVALLEVA